MSEVLDFGLLLSTEKWDFDLYCDELGKNMTSLGVHQDCSDFDELLDITGDITENTESCTTGSLSDYTEVIDWYTIQPQISKPEYDTQTLEIEKEKFRKENEVGLLEALQKSMELECDTVSEFVSLSSSLSHPPSPLSANSPPFPSLSTSVLCVSPTKHAGKNDAEPENLLTVDVLNESSSPPREVDKPKGSVLKQLLTDTEINYPREVDSNSSSSAEHASVKLKSQNDSSNTADGKNSKKKKSTNVSASKKPFTELLKHFETSGSEQSSRKPLAGAKPVRVLNETRYMRQYGSAPSSRLPSPTGKEAPPAPSLKAGKAARARPVRLRRKQSAPATAPAAKSARSASAQGTTARQSSQTNNNVIVAPDADSLLDILESDPQSDWSNSPGPRQTGELEKPPRKPRVPTDKRRSAVLIDALPHKRPRTGNDLGERSKVGELSSQPATPSNVECVEKPFAEHDYCQPRRKPEESNGADILSAAIQASGLGSKPQQDEALAEEMQGRSSAANKVLKWQDYLQRVRLGIRSAPNSPTSSPKTRRGSARPANNFMVGVSAPAVKTPANTGPQLVKPILAAKAPKQKPPLQLQEFEEYLAKLQKSNGDEAGEVAAPANGEASSGCVSSDSVKCVAAVSQPQAVEAEQKSANSAADKQKRPKPRSRPIVVPQVTTPFVKISSGGVIHTAAVTPVQTVSCSGAPLVMIKIPKANSNYCSAVGLNVQGCVSAAGAGTAATVVDAAKTPQSAEGASQQRGLLLKDPRVSNAKATTVEAGRPQPAVLKAIPKAKWNASLAGGAGVKGKPKPPSSAGPTFKLVTSKKDGVETKSLILSGVTGKLKDLLTALAQQQKQQSATATPVDPKQQQETLQQLLAALTNMNRTNQTTPATATVSSPATNHSLASQSQTGSAHSISDAKSDRAAKKTAVPSPLSLIHEIKQNLSKKAESAASAAKLRRRYIYTVPASSTKQRQAPNGGASVTVDSSELSSASPPVAGDLAQRRNSGAGSCQSLNERRDASPSDNLYSDLGDFSLAVDSDPLTVFVDQGVDRGAERATAGHPAPSTSCDAAVEPTLDDALLEGNYRCSGSPASNIPSVDMEGNACQFKVMLDPLLPTCSATNTSADLGLASSSIHSEVCSASNPSAATGSDCSASCTNSSNQPVNANLKDAAVVATNTSAPAGGSDGVQEEQLGVCSSLNRQSPVEKTRPGPGCDNASEINCTTARGKSGKQVKKIPLRRTMAASDLLEGEEDVLFEVLPSCASVDPCETSVDVVEETLGAPVAGGIDERDDGGLLFNKLPAYLYTGKVLSAGTTTGKAANVDDSCAAMRGMKDTSSDPLIGVEGSSSDAEELHYNKVPHYLRGGKACPGMRRSSVTHGSSGSFASSQSAELDSYPALKRTPEGVLVNTKELYYSRLPSYYSAGRQHVVDTVTEPPPREDETVTPETMWKLEQKEKQRKREARRKRKKKRSKRKKKKQEQPNKDRILYSKIPHYFLAGRRSLVPDRRTSEQSYSSSLSESSYSDDPGRASPSYRRRSVDRDLPSCPSERGRSSSVSSYYSNSPSRSPRRSWRYETNNRSRRRSPRRRSRNYSSSESEYSMSRSRRRRSYSSDSECEAPKRRRRTDDIRRVKKSRAIEERRVVYVGGIDDDTKKIDLDRKFRKFGEIEDIGLYFRKNKDSYAFVTFRYKCDTFTAIEQGNDDPTFPSYTLCFGGRREFCEVEYEDLDDAPDNRDNADEDDFDTLLKKAMRR